jgi:multidrug resistance efflux pump
MNSYAIKFFISSLLFILMLSGCAKSQEEKELKVSDNNVSIRIEGAVYPVQRQNIISSVAGKIKHLYIKYGDRVKKGEHIYSLDKELIHLDILNKQTEINSLRQIRRNFITNNNNAYNITDVNLAAIELKKMASLRSKGYIQSFQENNYKKNYMNALNSQKSQDTGNYEKLKTLSASITAKNIELQKLQYQLKHADGYANIDGFVADLQAQEGQTIGSDKKICTIINIDKVIVRAGFATGLLPFIQRNKEVSINFVTTPPYSVKSTIKQITPIVNPKFERMTFDVVVPNKHYILQSGTRALVTITLPKEGQESVKKYFLNDKRDKVIQISSEI